MYDLVYQFILNNIFNSQSLDSYSSEVMGVTTNMNVYLSHSLTILFFVVLCICVWTFVKWLFHIVSGLFLLR